MRTSEDPTFGKQTGCHSSGECWAREESGAVPFFLATCPTRRGRSISRIREFWDDVSRLFQARSRVAAALERIVLESLVSWCPGARRPSRSRPSLTSPAYR